MDFYLNEYDDDDLKTLMNFLIRKLKLDKWFLIEFMGKGGYNAVDMLNVALI